MNCKHDWMQRGTPGDLWRECWLCYAVEEDRHIVVSVAGWTCDVCGVSVNGQTNELGIPLQDGDAVFHTPDFGSAS